MKRIGLLLILSLVLPVLFACAPGNSETTDAATTQPAKGSTDTMTETETGAQDGTEDAERYFSFRIWNFTLTPQSDFEKAVDGAKVAGFNAIMVHIPWHYTEHTPGNYVYDRFDNMISYAAQTAGMKIIVSLDMSRKWEKDSETDGVVNSDELQTTSDGNVCAGGAWYNRAMISYSSKSGMDKVCAYYEDAVKHFDGKFGDDILMYLPAFSLYCETEYYCGEQLDYSASAREGFAAWLKEKYGQISALNTAIGTSYADFSQIAAPSALEALGLGLLWYQYRETALKNAIDRLADITHKNTKSDFAVQLGCVFDTAVPLRATADVAYLCENVDVLWIDDAPSYNHGFSCDYTASMLPDGMLLAQEIDGPTTGVYEDFLKQGLQCFAHGCTYVGLANWSAEQAFEDGQAAEVWREISDTYIINKTPSLSWSGELEIDISDMILSKKQKYYQNLYNDASENCAKRIKYTAKSPIVEQTPTVPEVSASYPDDFSSVQGGKGWYYWQYKDGKFTELSWDESSSSWKGSAEFTLVTPTMLHPDAYAPALSYKAEQGGEYELTFSASVVSDKSDGIKMMIFVNDTRVFPTDGAYTVKGGEYAEETLTVTVGAGDYISFVIDRNVTNSYDTTNAVFTIRKAE